jgi:hypothetical protein
MAFAKLIDTTYLLKRSMVEENVDAKLLNTFIITAQDRFIQSILGENLYQKIMNDVATTGTSTGQYLVLLKNYIQPALMWASIYEALPFLTFKITNQTVMQKTSDHSTAATDGNVNWLRNIVKNNADFYNQRIREFIINDPSSFPEYWTTVGIERITPRRSTYFSGMYLPRHTKKIRKKPGYSDPDCCGDNDPSGTPVN